MTIEPFPQTSLGAAAAAVVDGIAPKREPFAPGIYFGLEEDVYHADAALGSSAMKKLAESPPDYWWDSPHNTMRPKKKDTPSRIFGRAVHKFVAEGRTEFECAYAPADFNGSTKEGKAESARIAAAGRIRLVRDDWDRIMVSGTVIRANPKISEAFSGGVPEVSIFWERDGIRRKARIDYLKPRASVDLKSESNPFGLHFPVACRKAIDKYKYAIQAGHYREARELIPRFAADGAVYGDHDASLLKKIMSATEYAWVWIFYQSERSPLTWGKQISPGNPVFDDARADIARAEENYRRFADVFGFTEPWVIAEDLEELDPDEIKWPYQGMGK